MLIIIFAHANKTRLPKDGVGRFVFLRGITHKRHLKFQKTNGLFVKQHIKQTI